MALPSRAPASESEMFSGRPGVAPGGFPGAGFHRGGIRETEFESVEARVVPGGLTAAAIRPEDAARSRSRTVSILEAR